MFTADEVRHLAAIGTEAAQQLDLIEGQIKAAMSNRNNINYPAPPHLLPKIQEFLMYKGFAVSIANPSMLIIGW